ncbi:Aste57867_14699 [Aphanomyces stellatus]|uniref:Aste57867_14699 protein n=1 Tax=Aphanomyces stellatus TaxID=120398 RepID=A0A485L257_9STRA|nr:hypothetical protein As57867_014644 [Aphanomyces stellatus]VFT91517.1 Aste57867_14699 [Aphanomyces stellatus]
MDAASTPLLSSFDLTLPHLYFSSTPHLKGGFRVRLVGDSDDKDRFVLNFESKRHKSQWECTIASSGDYAPSGVTLPPGLIFTLLEATLVRQDAHAKELSQWNMVTTHPASVNLTSLPDGSLRLVLHATLFGRLAQMEFAFALTPLAVDSLTVLQAKLEDVQESIVRLEKEQTKVHDRVDERLASAFLVLVLCCVLICVGASICRLT